MTKPFPQKLEYVALQAGWGGEVKAKADGNWTGALLVKLSQQFKRLAISSVYGDRGHGRRVRGKKAANTPEQKTRRQGKGP